MSGLIQVWSPQLPSWVPACPPHHPPAPRCWAPACPPVRQVPISVSPVAGKKIVPVTVWEWSGLGAGRTAGRACGARRVPAMPALATRLCGRLSGRRAALTWRRIKRPFPPPDAPDPRPVADEGDEAAEWLTSYLGIPVRLARYAGRAGDPGPPSDDPQRRAVDPAWTPSGAETETAFADGFPFLLANAASLDDLNKQLAAKGETALPINRFRPNFVVAGAQPWQEDSWAGLRLGSGDGGVAFDNVKPCDRCKVGWPKRKQKGGCMPWSARMLQRRCQLLQGSRLIARISCLAEQPCNRALSGTRPLR